MDTLLCGAVLSAVTRGAPYTDRNPGCLSRLLYLSGDSHSTDEACLEDSTGSALLGEDTGWSKRGLSGPSRLYVEFYCHSINRIALCIMHTDDDFGCFIAKGF
jgi:hypothetical protein